MKPHTTDAVSLTFGLVFLGIAGLWTVRQVASLSAATTSAAAAGSLIVLGLLGIALAWRSAQRDDSSSGPGSGPDQVPGPRP